MTKQLVMLDRDGVINHDSADYIKCADEWQPIPGSMEAIALLHTCGYTICVATNQAGIARGKLTEQDLTGIHEKMLAAVSAAGGHITHIEYCPHHPLDHCSCRKPAPGMLHAIGKSLGVNIEGNYFVGDSLKDIRAAEAAGCQPILVLTGNGQETNRLHHEGVQVYESLLAFAEDITRRDSQP